MLPIGSRSRRLLNQSTHSSVAYSTANEELAVINQFLQSAPGVGPIIAATVISDLRELGRVDRRAIAVPATS
jgi:hypothetical protein